MKENEYLLYLQHCLDAIDEVVLKTQAAVRGFLARQRVK